MKNKPWKKKSVWGIFCLVLLGCNISLWRQLYFYKQEKKQLQNDIGKNFSNLQKIETTLNKIYSLANEMDTQDFLSLNKLSINTGIELVEPESGISANLDDIDRSNLANYTRGLCQFSSSLKNQYETLADNFKTRKLQLNNMPSILPAKGYISSKFGMRWHPLKAYNKMHSGIDIKAAKGSLVRAAAAGKVIETGRVRGYGLYLLIDHGNSISTKYAHNAKLLVHKGQRVAKGQAISTVGSSGEVTGTHLHYEVRIKGKPVDPENFLLETPSYGSKTHLAYETKKRARAG